MRMFRNYKLIESKPAPGAVEAEALMDEWDAKIDAIDSEIRRLVAQAERMETIWEEAVDRMEAEDWAWVLQNLKNPNGVQ